ncbi:MAG: hypothetical protein WCS70_11395 [Verrucomicrobiota bacterium]
MSYENPIDTRQYTYEEWIRFAFDHPCIEHPSDDPWHYTEEYEFICDPGVVLRYYVRLFREPLPSLSAYSDEQIEQGLWFIACHHLPEIFGDKDVSPTERIECIEAMPFLFHRFFCDKPLGTICYMWWDLIGHCVEAMPDEQVVDATLHSLEKILALDSPDCQMSALHGLGHLKHPGKERIIRSYLAQNPELTDEARAYAEEAILGTVL